MKLPRISSSVYRNVGTNLVAMLILNTSAFINRFPLVYSDTGTYIHYGFSGDIPIDRPIFYGLFIKHTSFGLSPWITILFQGLIVAWLLRKIFENIYRGRQKHLYFIVSIICLTLTTGVSFNVSLLIPDIFSSICLLGAFLIVFDLNHNRGTRILYFALLSFGITTHLSNIPILLISVLAFYGLFRLFKTKFNSSDYAEKLKQLKLVLVIVISTVVVIPVANYLLDRKLELSSGGHVFIINHLKEIGVLQEHLKNNCQTNDYNLCNFQNQLNGDFMWDGNSPLYITGGWISNKDEYWSLIFDILKTPRYYPKIFVTGVSYTLTQYFTFYSKIDIPQRENSPPYSPIKWRFNPLVQSYLNSLQNTVGFNLKPFNRLESTVLYFSVLLIILIANSIKDFTIFHSFLFWFIIFSIVSAAVCSNLSTINARYMNRIIWLIPFIAFTGLMKIIGSKWNTSKKV